MDNISADKVFSSVYEVTNLVLFTDAFPYGRGEKPFLAPEVEALSKRCRITLVTQVSEEVKNDVENFTILPEAVSLVTISSSTILDYIRVLPQALLSKMLIRELRYLLDDGFSIRRLVDSFKTILAAMALRRACVRKGVFLHTGEVLYYSFWFNYKLLAVCLEADSRDVPMMIWGRVNGYDLYNERNANGRQPFQQVMRDICSNVLFGSSIALNYFTDHFGEEVFEGQYVLNRLGVREGVQASRIRSRNPFLLVSCANVIPLKRVTLIAEAIARLSNPSIRWVHFGDGPDLSKVKKIVDTPGCNFWLPGAVPNNQVLSFYREQAVGCFIALSATEGGCPVSLQEALSFGLPAIATAAGGAQYECVDQNGIRLPDDASVDDVVEAIDAIYRLDDDSWMSMSNRSLELWRERFDVRKCKSQLLALIDKEA